MTTRLGHVSVDHGRIGKHRNHPGGRDDSILFDKYHPGYFGKVGMRYFHKLRNHYHCPVVNIDKLWSLVPEDVKTKATVDNVSLIDVTQFGYFKVLGKGKLPSQLIIVKANIISKLAKKNIKEAGGVVMLTA